MKGFLTSLCLVIVGCTTKVTPLTVASQSEKMVYVIQKVEIGGIPLGIPVLGLPGHLYSPHAKYNGYVDARDCSTGDILVCPFTGKDFLVP